MKKALIIATVSGFLMQFEMQNVAILQDMGYEVHYASNCNVPKYRFDAEELAHLGIRVHSVPMEKSPARLRRNALAVRRVEQIIRAEGITLIHCHTPVGGLVGRLAGMRCRDLGVRVVYTAHGFHFYRGCPKWDLLLYRTAERLLARETDALVVINREDYESASAFQLKEGGQVYRIPGVGLDRDRFHPFSEQQRQAARQRLGIGENDILLLSVGEVNRNKNHVTALKALERILKENTDRKRIRYLICGEGSERPALEAWIRQHGMEHAAACFGYCNLPEEIYGAADLFLFPSRREGLGMAALEALACGVPVAAADNRGTREYVLPGENGWLCRWDEPGDYAAAFRQWESLTEKEKIRMREKCRASTERFGKQYTAQVMKQVYRDTCGG
ncbi:MAG: glycosyltransferase [Lachnospiraceae bacterium]|nr:glycosyltransferase [Lachnospiraceae bacterium]